MALLLPWIDMLLNGTAWSNFNETTLFWLDSLHLPEMVRCGSTCKQGEIEAVVIATGVHTFFGKAAHLVDTTNQVGHFQKVLAAIGNFLSLLYCCGDDH